MKLTKVCPKIKNDWNSKANDFLVLVRRATPLKQKKSKQRSPLKSTTLFNEMSECV